jgi:hypothetical protein
VRSILVSCSGDSARKAVCCRDYDPEENDSGEIAFEPTYDFCLPRFPAIGVLWEFQ